MARRGNAESVGGRLERDRLLHRLARLDRVARLLRARTREHARAGRAVPPALQHSLSDFERELEVARAELRAL